jgi:ubiquinone/menaquinone biosynthesis C-methylase UbiE
MKNKNMEKERVIREKEWHNRIHGSDVRDSTGKFYSVIDKVTQHKYVEYMDCNATILLDYGCGKGYYVIGVANYIKEGIGIDISEAFIEEAKVTAHDKKIENLEFFVMDAMNTSFDDNKFDIIRGNGILHHLDIKKSLCEIRRILKVGGTAYFFEPLATNPFIELYRRFTPHKRTVDEQPFRKKELKIIKSIFPECEIEYANCFTLLAVPFRNLKNFDKILKMLRCIDNYILSNSSPFRWLAWTCYLTLYKNIK